jgi:hypothetical protein
MRSTGSRYIGNRDIGYPHFNLFQFNIISQQSTTNFFECAAQRGPSTQVPNALLFFHIPSQPNHDEMNPIRLAAAAAAAAAVVPDTRRYDTHDMIRINDTHQRYAALRSAGRLRERPILRAPLPSSFFDAHLDARGGSDTS